MTGFGQYSDEVATVSIAAVNHRNTQVHVRGNLRSARTEEVIRRRVAARIGRGSCTVQVQMQRRAEEIWDVDNLRACYRSLAELARVEGAPPPRMEAVASFAMRSVDGDDEALRESLLAATDSALDAFDRERRREGGALAAALEEQRAAMAELCDRIAVRSEGRCARHRDRLVERLRELLAAETAVDDSQLIRELALYADRIDISEELVRWRAHLDALRDLLAAGDDQPLGKRLDFLLQETGREINTTGSKANDAALAQMVVDAKSLLESMREQAANVW